MKNVAVVGATGAVGVEMVKVLLRRQFPVASLKLLASKASAGKTMRFGQQRLVVEELTEQSFRGVDIALFSAGGEVSRKFAPVAVSAGAVVIDNSSYFRLDERVPLVIPPINPEAVRGHNGIIANPNCTTAIVLMALWPLHKAFGGVRRVVASSFQAVSGTGAKAVLELERQVGQIARGEVVTSEVYPHQIAFNVLPHVGSFLGGNHTAEEMKLLNEGRKIMGNNGFRASMTCVRVPVYRAHSVAVMAEFRRSPTVKLACEALQNAKGVQLLENDQYPTPLLYSGMDDCGVGRIRQDKAFANGLSFWVVGDQLLRGAALNAVEIAELLL
jgi:aspartate-semialdehyde dehydrogenase